jgi:hypothetical protein
MTDFLKFLVKRCTEKSALPDCGTGCFSDERASAEAYKDILIHIETFLEKYSEQKKLSNDAERAFISAIETDQRRQFDDPVELIQHIQKIASSQPFFDSERVSLSAIAAFCNDYTYRHNLQIRQELIQSAPF